VLFELQFHVIFAVAMKKAFILIFFTFFLSILFTQVCTAQCSICAKSVMQMGTKPAQGFNSGILYLMIIPYVAIGVIAYKWWKSNR
jgi:hypothetical protein